MRLLACCLLALLLPGCASPSLLHRTDVALGGSRFAEANLSLAQGQAIHWEWTATAGMHFDVHTHGPDGRAIEAIAKDGASDTGSFTAPANGTYSLLWLPRSTAVKLSYSITGEGKVLSVVP